MELSEYQQHALKTALPTSLNLDYLVPMIIGEIGELFGQKAKAVRDTWAPDDLQKMLISEYGDIAWGTAILLNHFGIHEVPDSAFHRTPHPTNPWTDLLAWTQTIYISHEDFERTPNPQWLDYTAENFWATLKFRCKKITGREFDMVLSSNVDKLARRAQAGTVSGSGDLR